MLLKQEHKKQVNELKNSICTQNAEITILTGKAKSEIVIWQEDWVDCWDSCEVRWEGPSCRRR